MSEKANLFRKTADNSRRDSSGRFEGCEASGETRADPGELERCNVCGSMKEDTEKDPGELERCVLCGRLTDVRKDTPVPERKTYLQGAGQLCGDCCFELYHTTDLRTISEM